MAKKIAGLGLVWFGLFLTVLSAGELTDKIELKGNGCLKSDPNVEMRLSGPVGERIENNIAEWVIRAPKANPALLAVFALRDRQPESDSYYVPWVGEFIGKFLTNSIASLRLSDNPELEKTVRALVEELIAAQSEDGYLGPFPKEKRLLVCWDLWGHYHAITALLMWYERTGDERAFNTCLKAADFICDTFLDTGHRMKDAGSHEMNLSIITSFCQLYRLTGNDRYFRMVNEILADWEDTGDYYRSGLTGIDYYQTPRPRWESIHCMLGLPELYRITGDESYKTAYMNLWRSALLREVHNNGSFSTDEQTIGHPFGKGAIETCCTVAWMAMTTETLRLTGSLEAADALEAATYNAVMAYQNPSGSWSTYNTPMNGRREASFHSIVFQSRPGQPELNCCSVNAPRGLALVSEWGLLKGTDESGNESLVLNYYGPGTMKTTVNGEPVTLTQTTRYPCDGTIGLKIETAQKTPFSILLRVPQWAKGGTIQAGNGAENLTSGTYYTLKWDGSRTDTVTLNFPMPLRYESGDLEFADTMSIFRGPILLTYDQRYNEFEADAVPTLTPDMLDKAEVIFPEKDERGEIFGAFTPMVQVTIPAEKPLVLTDFATAGVLGTTYASWLPAQKILPPIPACLMPKNGAKLPASPITLQWRPMAHPERYAYTVMIAETPDFSPPILTLEAKNSQRVTLSDEEMAQLKPNQTYYWTVAVRNEIGNTPSREVRSFQIDPSLPIPEVKEPKLLISDDLAGKPNPTAGKLAEAVGMEPATGPDGAENGSVRLDGQSGIVTYELDEFPAEFTMSVDFYFESYARDQSLGELVSAWCGPNDDPLRVYAEWTQIYGKIEGNLGGRTSGQTLERNCWHHLTVVQDDSAWTIYLDHQYLGQIAGTGKGTASKRISLGGNPLYRDKPEFAKARFAHFRLYDQAIEE